MDINVSGINKKQKIQEKVLTNWINSLFLHEKKKVTSLGKDLCDGKILTKVLEKISGENHDILIEDKEDNVFFYGPSISCITQIIDIDFKSKYTAKDIVDGNLSKILELCWDLVLIYVVPNFNKILDTEKSVLLLKWVQIEIKDFDESWKDGMVFCSLLNDFDDILFDIKSINSLKGSKKMEFAFEGFKQIGVPRILDVEDVISNPDKNCIILYTSLYHSFYRKKSYKILKEGEIRFSKNIQTFIRWIQTKINEITNPQKGGSLTMKQLQEVIKEKQNFSTFRCFLQLKFYLIQQKQKQENFDQFFSSNIGKMNKCWLNLNENIMSMFSSIREFEGLSEEEPKYSEFEEEAFDFLQWMILKQEQMGVFTKSLRDSNSFDVKEDFKNRITLYLEKWGEVDLSGKSTFSKKEIAFEAATFIYLLGGDGDKSNPEIQEIKNFDPKKIKLKFPVFKNVKKNKKDKKDIVITEEMGMKDIIDDFVVINKEEVVKMMELEKNKCKIL